MKIVLLVVAALLIKTGAGPSSAKGFQSPETVTVSKPPGSCSECHQKQSPQLLKLFDTSTHAQMGISCTRCHGGNVSASNKQAAHGGRFVGNPSPVEVVTMCGSCHTAERAALKASKHFVAETSAPKVDCSGCHGAHGVGSVERNFSLANFCANCHGVEYLPALTADIEKIVRSVDEATEWIRVLKIEGRAPSEELAMRRKQLRNMVSQIVHSTDISGGAERLPQVLKLAGEIKQLVDREKR